MLNLYEGITPNHSATHYIFSNFDNYLALLESHKLKEIPPNNYTIDNLFIRCKLDSVLTANNYKNVTYIINTDDEVCYLVNSTKVLSGFVYFSITVDNWGTYLHKASLKDILIKRCNRKLSDNGIYDEVIVTNEYEIDKLGTDTQLCLIVYYTAVANVNSDSVGYTVLINTSDSIMAIISKLANVTKVYGDGVQIFSNVSIKRAWVVPYDIVNEYFYIPTTNTSFRDRNNNVIYENLRELIYISEHGAIKTETITYTSYSLNYNILIGNFGTSNSEVRTTKGTKTINFNYMIAPELKLIANFNNKVVDITSSIEIPLRSRSSEQEIHNLGNIIRIMGSGLFAVISKNPYTKAKSGISALQGVVGLIENTRQEEINENNMNSINNISSGDAIITYDGSMSNNTPYRIFKALSIKDEEKHARKLGATFNEYVDTLTEIYSKAFLGTGTSNDDTYISANIEISNIPLDAINEITGKFNNGVNTQLL